MLFERPLSRRLRMERKLAMKTIRLEEPGRLVLTSTDPPAAPQSGEVLVRVRRIGVCGTDIHAFHGDQPFFCYPRILGHELGVEVVQMGDSGGGLKTGDLCSVNLISIAGAVLPAAGPNRTVASVCKHWASTSMAGCARKSLCPAASCMYRVL